MGHNDCSQHVVECSEEVYKPSQWGTLRVGESVMTIPSRQVRAVGVEGFRTRTMMLALAGVYLAKKKQ